LAIYLRFALRRYAPLRIASPRNATFLFVDLSSHRATTLRSTARRSTALRGAARRNASHRFIYQFIGAALRTASPRGASQLNVSFVNLPALRSTPHRVAALCSAPQRFIWQFIPAAHRDTTRRTAMQRNATIG
jgi:hypothetical protein